MSIVVVATITPQDGKLADVIAAFAEATPAIQGEPGCEQYASYSDGEVVVTIERWSDPSDLETHMRGDAITRLLERAGSLLATEPEIRTIESLGFGDAVKGD